MNESLANQESKEKTPKPKFFSLIRPLAGAIIGITVFLLLLLLMQATESRLLAVSLLWLGILAEMLDIPSGMVNLFVISSIPLAIIGSLITSNQKVARESGIILLVIYSAISIFAGILILFFGNIMSS